MPVVMFLSSAAAACLLCALPVVHIVTTVRTGCIQRKIFSGIRASLKRGAAGSAVSPFEALSVTLASTIGTGNIVGVGAAVALGGPGAVFWIVLTGFFGIATKYAETYIALTSRVRGADGIWRGGAMYVLAKRLKMPLLGAAFALFTAVASFGIGCGVQSSAVASALPFPHPFTGAVLCVLTAAALAGGLTRVSKSCAMLVPFMAALYLGGCAALLYIQRDYISDAIALIISSALAPRAVGGGVSVSAALLAMRVGVSRGLFSNEAGLGSAPLAASCADIRDLPLQALIAATGTFWDTIVVCSVTGLTAVSGLLMYPQLSGCDGGTLMSALFSHMHGGEAVLAVSICIFAYSTVLGWSVYGLRSAEYLGGRHGERVYRILFIAALYLGAVCPMDGVWALSDVFNALMAFPNIAAVLLLSGETGRAARERFGQKNSACREGRRKRVRRGR